MTLNRQAMFKLQGNPHVQPGTKWSLAQPGCGACCFLPLLGLYENGYTDYGKVRKSIALISLRALAHAMATCSMVQDPCNTPRKCRQQAVCIASFAVHAAYEIQ
eukprot:GHRR01027838.1.p1 GENE.GHRR01027838.1~~GHRR01027838.1.p1  ORF type:complete len:104 (+),score=5.77 GHRR01027838.1:134-445(+)